MSIHHKIRESKKKRTLALTPLITNGRNWVPENLGNMLTVTLLLSSRYPKLRVPGSYLS